MLGAARRTVDSPIGHATRGGMSRPFSLVHQAWATMRSMAMKKLLAGTSWFGALLWAATGAVAATTVYRCPGPPVLYTDQITAQEAKDRNCRTIEGAPITVVSPPKPRPVAGSPANGGAARPSEGKVGAGEQRSRDSDARKILESELRREETKLAELQKEFNNGQPERKGDERNYQKYLDRVEEMKAAIARKESDIEALKRELTKMPASKE